MEKKWKPILRFASAIIDDELQKKLRNLLYNFPPFLSRPWLKSIGSTEIIDEIIDSSYDVIDAFSFEIVESSYDVIDAY